MRIRVVQEKKKPRRMVCLTKVIHLARECGATVDSDYIEMGCLIVDAPLGYSWNDNAGGCIIEAASNGDESWWWEACRDTISRMRMGLTICTSDERAAIEIEKDQTWVAPAGSPQTIAVE